MLNELCNLNGISGREHAVRDYIISNLPSDAEYRIDPLGSLIVYKEGKAEPKNKVMLDAHMDEVGFIITYITEDGYLKFTTVGGIDERVIFGRAVKVGKELIPGVIGGKAIHQTTSEERGKLPSVEDMYIDIGASSKKEALSHVSLGDAVYFDSCYREFGDGFIKAKAIDDRVGCEILLRLINSDLPYSATFCFSVQEEIGTRGAAAAAYSVAPDFAIVVEGTTAADISGVPDEKKSAVWAAVPLSALWTGEPSMTASSTKRRLKLPKRTASGVRPKPLWQAATTLPQYTRRQAA